MESYINAELDVVKKYRDEKFEDSDLQELAIEYINCLNDQNDALEYLTVDYTKYSELHKEAYNKRTTIIKQMVDDYGLTVSDDYQSDLNDLLTNAKIVKEDEDKQAKIDALVSSIVFEVTEDDGYGYKTYGAVVENTTGIDFTSFGLSINLLDADGVIVESEYSSVENFNNGAKARFEFFTDVEFTSYQITVDYWNE